MQSQNSLSQLRLLAIAVSLIIAAGCQSPGRRPVHTVRTESRQAPIVTTPSAPRSSLRLASATKTAACDTTSCAPAEIACDDPFGCAPKRITFQEDWNSAWPALCGDTRSLFTWENAMVLGVFGGGAIAMRDSLDTDVRNYTAEHPLRWGKGSEALGYLGDYRVVTPSLFALYGLSLWKQDEELHDVSGTLLSTYALTTAATTIIKVAANTSRPSSEWNSGQYGFPSHHSATAFSIAAVLDEYYGLKYGGPAYVVAGLVAWSRLDERDHDLSDVVFGAALGWVIGKSVASRHLGKNCRLVPHLNPNTGDTSMNLEISY